MSGKQIADRLLKFETRLPEPTAEQLRQLAATNRRSVAAEIRVAVEQRIADASLEVAA